MSGKSVIQLLESVHCEKFGNLADETVNFRYVGEEQPVKEAILVRAIVFAGAPCVNQRFLSTIIVWISRLSFVKRDFFRFNLI